MIWGAKGGFTASDSLLSETRVYFSELLPPLSAWVLRMSSKAVERVGLREKEVSWDLQIDGELDGGSGGGDRLVRREGDLGSE